MAGKMGKAARMAMLADSSKRGGRGSGRQEYEYEGDFTPERGYADTSSRMGRTGREMYGQERMGRGYDGRERMGSDMYGERGYGRQGRYTDSERGYDRRERYGEDERMMGRQGRQRSGRMGRYGEEYDEYESDDDEEYHQERKPIRAGGTFWMDTPEKVHKLTMEKAQEWVGDMENEDPAHPEGGKWTVEQVKPLAQKYGIPADSHKFIDFYVMMNAMYSDYGEVAKKYGATSPDFFAEMAKAFICDKDAVKDKTAKYYEYIVKK